MTHSILIVGGTREKRGDVVAQFTARSRFDTMILEPEEDKQAISIVQVRDLQHQLSLKPHSAKYKTGIILEAQRMTVEAQNALLKTLEEPPAHSVLILTAPSTRSLLPTIVSRCQITRLPPAIDIDFESEEYKKGAEEFLKLLTMGRGERLAWVEENKTAINRSAGSPLADNQQSAISFLEVWISVLRDLLLITSGCQPLTLNPLSSLNPQNPPNPLGNFTKRDNCIALCSIILLTQKTKNLIAKTNISPRLALEVLLLELPVLER